MEIAGFSEVAWRLGAFTGVFAAMALLDLLIPKRRLEAPRAKRWPTNLAIVGIDSLLGIDHAAGGHHSTDPMPRRSYGGACLFRSRRLSDRDKP